MQVNFWYLTMDNRANIVTVPCSLLVDLAIIYLQTGGFRPSWWGVEASGNPTLNILLATPSFAIALIWAFCHHQAPKLWVCVLILVLTWKARMRLGGCCIRVWRSLMRLPTRRCCVWVFFVFFFFSDLHRLDFDSRRTGLIRPELGCIGHIGPYRRATEIAEIGRNWPGILLEKPKFPP